MSVVGKGRWNECGVGKFVMKLERLKLVSSSRSLKARVEVGKYISSWKVTDEVEKQLKQKLSNFRLSNSKFFPTTRISFS